MKIIIITIFLLTSNYAQNSKVYTDTVYHITIIMNINESDSCCPIFYGLFKNPHLILHENTVLEDFYSQGIFCSWYPTEVLANLLVENREINSDSIGYYRYQKSLISQYGSEYDSIFKEYNRFLKFYGRSAQSMLEVVKVSPNNKYYKFYIRKFYAEIVEYDYTNDIVFEDKYEKQIYKPVIVNYNQKTCYIKKIFGTYKVDSENIKIIQ